MNLLGGKELRKENRSEEKAPRPEELTSHLTPAASRLRSSSDQPSFRCIERSKRFPSPLQRESSRVQSASPRRQGPQKVFAGMVSSVLSRDSIQSGRSKLCTIEFLTTAFNPDDGGSTLRVLVPGEPLRLNDDTLLCGCLTQQSKALFCIH